MSNKLMRARSVGTETLTRPNGAGEISKTTVAVISIAATAVVLGGGYLLLRDK